MAESVDEDQEQATADHQQTTRTTQQLSPASTKKPGGGETTCCNKVNRHSNNNNDDHREPHEPAASVVEGVLTNNVLFLRGDKELVTPDATTTATAAPCRHPSSSPHQRDHHEGGLDPAHPHQPPLRLLRQHSSSNFSLSTSQLRVTSSSILRPGGGSSSVRREPPPDGGWGWVIVFASFMISLISDGISLSSGTIFVELLDYFEESKSKTSWVLSIILSMPLLAGPIASYLTDRYGCRTMCILGSILAASGFIISFAANSLELLYFTFTISGFGLALCLVTSVVIIPYYFEKKRGLATGLSVCGTGIGTFLFPPLVSYLLESYGWRGTFLILAGFFLNIAVFGSLMRDLETDPFKRSESSSEDGVSRDFKELCPEDEFSGLDGMNPRLCNSLLQLPTYLQREFLSSSRTGAPPLNQPNSDHENADQRPSLSRQSSQEEEETNNGTTSPQRPFLAESTLWKSQLLSTTGTAKEDPNLNGPESCFLARPLTAALEPFPPSLLKQNNVKSSLLSPNAVNTLVHLSNSDSGPPIVSIFDNQLMKRKTTSPRQSTGDGGPGCGAPGSGAVVGAAPGAGKWVAKSFSHNSEYLKKLRLQRGSLTYRGAMLNIPRYKLRTSSCPDIYRNSIMTISESTKKYQFLHDLKEVLLDMVDLKIFSNVRFSFFCISNFILYACVDIPYVYLQDYAINLGFEKEPASFLISVLGILNTLGMVIVGYFGDKAYVDSALLYMGFVIVCGFSMAIIPFVTHYAILASMAALYGFTISANYTLMSVIVVNLISLDNFTSAYGMLLLIQGIASLVGPPVAGVLYDQYDTYDLTFLTTGLSIILSGALVLPVIRSYPFRGCQPLSDSSCPLPPHETNERPSHTVRHRDEEEGLRVLLVDHQRGRRDPIKDPTKDSKDLKDLKSPKIQATSERVRFQKDTKVIPNHV